MLPALLLSAAPDFAPGQVLVRFNQDVRPEQVARWEQAGGLERLQTFQQARPTKTGGLLMLYRKPGQSTAQLRAELTEDPHVAYAEPNYFRTLYALPDDGGFDQLWGLHNTGQNVNGISGTADADIDYSEAWKLSRDPASEVVVGVADTGMSIRHPDLSDNLWQNPGETAGNGIDDDGNGYIDDVHGYDFGDDTRHMVDNNGHGTHVCGTIGAADNNAIGIAGVYGKVRLIPLKIEASDGRLYTSDIIEAFLYAADLKERGVNLVAVNASFGGTSYSQAEYDSIDAMHEAGIVLCAAAGNESTNNDSQASYPANYELPNIISVAATDQNHALASFSNYGSNTVDLAAPGVNIYSTLPLNFINATTSLQAGGESYDATPLEHAGNTDDNGITGDVIACGLGYPNDFAGFVSGSIALIQRGELNFSTKVENAMAAGAAGVLIYNNENRPPATWTLGREDDWVPSFQLTKRDGETILAGLPLQATMIHTNDPATAYQFLDGTSMATPHVAGAVAFAALNFPNDNLSRRIGRVLDNVTPIASLSGVVRTGGVLNLLRIVDSDSDELGDWWEEDHFDNLTADGSFDSDGDGQSDAEEFESLTDPRSSASRFSLRINRLEPTNSTTLEFLSASGRHYQLLWSDSLAEGNWQILQDNIIGDGSVVGVNDPGAAAAQNRFYQLKSIIP